MRSVAYRAHTPRTKHRKLKLAELFPYQYLLAEVYIVLTLRMAYAMRTGTAKSDPNFIE